MKKILSIIMIFLFALPAFSQEIFYKYKIEKQDKNSIYATIPYTKNINKTKIKSTLDEIFNNKKQPHFIFIYNKKEDINIPIYSIAKLEYINNKKNYELCINIEPSNQPTSLDYKIYMIYTKTLDQINKKYENMYIKKNKEIPIEINIDKEVDKKVSKELKINENQLNNAFTKVSAYLIDRKCQTLK